MYILLYTLVFYCNSVNGDIVEDVSSYFQSETFRKFQNVWEPQRKMYENAIAQSLTNGYGKNDQLSVFDTRPLTDILLSEGVIVDDHVATVVFSDLYLQQLPNLLDSKVSFALASNTLDVTSQLWKMIITANYEVFTEDLRRPAVQDPYKSSPFAFPQVQREGNVTIIAEDCKVTGHGLTRLHDHLVLLEHNTFHVVNCSFSVEITSPDSAGPPVIAPYFSTKHARVMEGLLTGPVRQELRVGLQAALYLYINSTAVLGASETSILDSQGDIFAKTKKDLSKSANMANEKTAEDSKIAIEMKPLTIVWNNMESSTGKMKLRFSNVTLYGLDSLYSAHAGGPRKDQDSISICDTLRLASLFVRGQVMTDTESDVVVAVVVAEVLDVELDLEYSVHDVSPITIDVIGWRSLEVSLLNPKNFPGKSVIVGYIQSKLATTIENHLKSVYLPPRSAKNKLRDST